MGNLRLVNNIRPGGRGAMWNAKVFADFDGLREIVKKLSDRRLEQIIRDAMEPMKDTAKRLAPVSQPPAKPTVYHGALRDSIEIIREDRGDGKVVLVLRAGNIAVYYGPYQEFNGRPFMRPAWDEHKDEMRAKIVTELKMLAAPSRRGEI